MATREPAPTYREPVVYDQARNKWVFDPHWLRWFQKLTTDVGLLTSDHGGLTGLADDDHLQYHNDARGDLRYQPLDSDLTAIAALATTAFGRGLLTLADATALGASHDHVAADVTDFDTQVRTSRLDQMAAPTASVSFNDQQATSFRVENRTSDPGSPTTGQIWLRTDL